MASIKLFAASVVCMLLGIICILADNEILYHVTFAFCVPVALTLLIVGICLPAKKAQRGQKEKDDVSQTK